MYRDMTDAERDEYQDVQYDEYEARLIDRQYEQEHPQVQCPECGAWCEVENYYLGGYGWHKVAFCTADQNHQTPVILDHGQYYAAVYVRQGLDYRIITRDAWNLERAKAECLTGSDFMARMEGGEAWQYEPDDPPTDSPFVIECEAGELSEPAYIVIRITDRMPQEVL